MSNALLSDVEARAERRRTRTRDAMWQDLVRQAWRRANAATDPAEARRWLGRAHRMLPQDGMIATALADAMLRDGDLQPAAALFDALARRHGTPEAWSGLATSAHLLGQADQARAALAAALRCSEPTEALRGLAMAVAKDGWCGLTADGVLHAGPRRPASVRMDGTVLRLRWSAGAAPLPANWRQATVVEVNYPAGAAVGSPLPLRVFAGVEGFAEAVGGGVRGWAWQPAAPARDPVLWAEGPLGRLRVEATDAADDVRHDRPLARPRRFALTTAQVAALGVPVALRGPDGRHLLGSPLDPGMEARADFVPVWADVVGPAPTLDKTPGKTRPGVDVVIPVYRGTAETLACVGSVLAARPRGTRVIVVDDASPATDLVLALVKLARRRQIVLLRLPENRGFPGAANAGMAAAAGRDVVLLNSDTLVPPGWLERLRDAAYSAPDIGTVTPLTNDGTIVSVPDPAGGNPAPDLPGTIAADALAWRANGDATVDIPVGVGFCLYVRRDCLDQAGPLREDLFAQGYGEENDLCLRARHKGWRSVAAAGVFVAHVGATSFGAARAHLVGRNASILARLHPGYDALVAAHRTADPLGPMRQAMDALRWAAGRRRAGAVVMVTHAGGGGVDRVVAARAHDADQAGLRPIVLRPHRLPDGTPALRVGQTGAGPFPNLIFAMPGGLPALAKLLRADRVRRVDIDHMLGHHHAVPDLAALLRVDLVSIVHDYARFCPRIALVSTERRYCGEPDVSGCEACIADLGSLLEDDPPVPVLIERSRRELERAARVIVPSADAAARLRRHFPGVAPVVEPWEDDEAWPPVPGPAGAAIRRVVVIGAIGVEKGYEVLLACVRDARARMLPLKFVVVGFTADDERLMAAGPAFVTGEYQEADAIDLIRAQHGQIALIPSVWPETWCFALSRAWQAGLAAVVFDLGAQAERVRRTGRGWVVPLGLSPRSINDALLRLAPGVSASQCQPKSK